MAVVSPRAARERGLTGLRLRFEESPLRHVDLVLLAAIVSIAGLGLVMVYSATRARPGIGGTSTLLRQGAFVAVGLTAMLAVMAVDYRRLREYALWIYGGTIGLLVLVVSPLGAQSKGAQAWFQVGGYQLQPSEFAKFSLVLALAGYCSLHRGDLDLRRLAVALGIGGAPIALTLLQPDFGTAMVLAVVVFSILAVAGLRLRHLLLVVALVAVASAVVLQAGMLKEYQVDRLTSFLDQGSDTGGDAYNVDQAKLAIGSGGLTGKGLFEGQQTKLAYVPEQHTDFIFTVVGEELGFLGGAVLLTLFALVMWRTWRAARLARDTFGTLCCVGVLGMLAFQVFENVGMTMGIMPVTGIPLPLMSYGGSSTIATLLCLGLVLNVQMRRFS